MFLVHRHTIRHCTTGQVVFKPVHVAADIRNALMMAKGLYHISPAFFVEAEGDWIGQHRLGGHELHFGPDRQSEAGDGVFAFVRSLSHRRAILVGHLRYIGCKAGQPWR